MKRYTCVLGKSELGLDVKILTFKSFIYF